MMLMRFKDKNLECVESKLRLLKKERLTVSWDTLEKVETEILYYETLLMKGIYYEPRF